jgi:hypothetical protein
MHLVDGELVQSGRGPKDIAMAVKLRMTHLIHLSTNIKSNKEKEKSSPLSLSD